MDRRTFIAAAVASASTLAVAPASAQANTNPLIARWPGPFEGLPPFDKIKPEHFEPGFDAAIAEQNTEIAAILANRAAATFENTILALERSGAALSRARPVYGVFTSLVSTPELRVIEKSIDAKLAAHSDAITQNTALFNRIAKVYENRARLTPTQQRLAFLRWDNFVRAGAQLPPAQKARVAAINQRMAALHNQFQENLLADENRITELTEAQMDGLPDSVKTALRAEAKSRNLTAAAALPNKGSSVSPYLTSATDRATREKVFRLFSNRGDMGGAGDNNAIVAEILKLRAERSKILGFKSYAHWRLGNTMAKTPENAMALMQPVWAAAIKRLGEEAADMQKLAGAEGKGVVIEPWDVNYYADKVRQARFNLDMQQARPYLQLDKLREAMFWVAGELHGLTFHELKGVPVVHPDIRVWEVKDRAGAHRAVWYFDPFARPGKRSGAWAAAYRGHETFEGKVTCITSNNSNFLKPAPGEPVLIDWSSATTQFHEFGHALHAILSEVPYASFGGLPRDYVEFPSQINEHWLETDQVLSRFALHHATGQPLPKTFIDSLKAAKTFNQGFTTVRLVSTALMDMKLHLLADGVVDTDAFERATLAELGMPKQGSMAHRIPQSYHFFSSENYAAGYYGYLWSDALTADAAEAFEAAPGGYYDKAVAASFRDNILAKGNAVPPADQFRAFRGRDVDPAALMRKKGFVT